MEATAIKANTAKVPASYFGGITTRNRKRRADTADNARYTVEEMYIALDQPWSAAYHAAECSHDAAVLAKQDGHAERAAQANLLRDIFGNPFRKVKFDKKWRTTDAKLLAGGIYEDKAFDRMPILADALQDAGCDNEDVLNHCRDTNATHVRRMLGTRSRPRQGMTFALVCRTSARD